MMSRRRLWRSLAVGASLVLLVSAEETVGETTKMQTLADVRAQVRAYERAWNSHDASQVAAFYAQDADMVMGNGPLISGRDAIREWWARYFAEISDARAGTFEVESVRMLADDVAVVNVDTLTAGRNGENDDLPARRARGTWIVVAHDGEWLIAALRGLPAAGDVRVQPGRDR